MRSRRGALALAVWLAGAGLGAPAAAAPLRLPPVLKVRLANGLRVFVVPVGRIPLVDLRLVARAGSVDDPPGKDGLASLTADLLAQGAGSRDARGDSLNAS